MKRIILITSIVMLTNIVHAQWIVNGSNIETEENIKLTNSGGHFFSIKNEDSSTEPAKIFVSGYDYNRGLQIGRDDGNHKIILSGNIGINNLTPSYQLDLNAGSNSTHARFIHWSSRNSG